MIKTTNKKVVVTGGAGLIGSHLTEILVQKKFEVTVIDDFSTGNIKNLNHIKDKIKLVKGNLEDKSFCMNVLKGFDQVFHLASRAYGIGYSEKNHLKLLIHNENITNNLIHAFRKFKPKEILIVSSSCVYDENGSYSPNEVSLFKGLPEMANMGYGWAKRFLEQKFKLLVEEIDAKLFVVRPFNIYGHRYCWKGEYSQAIPMIVKRVLDKENPINIWGSGKQQRSYVHASDCAELIYMIMNSNHHSFPINLGGYDTVSIKKLVEIICKVYNSQSRVIFDHSKPEGALLKKSDFDQIIKIFPDYKYKITLKEGISKMQNWYQETFEIENNIELKKLL